MSLTDANKTETEMNKSRPVEEASGKRGLTDKGTENVINIMAQASGNTLSRGEMVILVGFGTLQLAIKKGRRGAME